MMGEWTKCQGEHDRKGDGKEREINRKKMEKGRESKTERN